MKIDIVERPPVRIACLRYTGPSGEPLGRFWRGTVAPWLADHGLVDCPRYGVIVDDPMQTEAEQCRYDAGVELPPGLSLPDAAEATVRGGRYAITYFKGSSVEIGSAWRAFVNGLIASAPHRIDDSRPALEHMPRGGYFDARTGIFSCELCLPVVS